MTTSNLSQIVLRTDPAELEALRKAYSRRTHAALRYLANLLQVEAGATKAQTIAAILTTAATIEHSKPTP